jgi:hypothetical protein
VQLHQDLALVWAVPCAVDRLLADRERLGAALFLMERLREQRQRPGLRALVVLDPGDEDLFPGFVEIRHFSIHDDLLFHRDHGSGGKMQLPALRHGEVSHPGHGLATAECPLLPGVPGVWPPAAASGDDHGDRHPWDVTVSAGNHDQAGAPACSGRRPRVEYRCGLRLVPSYVMADVHVPAV